MQKPAVILTISKQPEVNILELTDRLDEAIVDLQKPCPKVSTSTVISLDNPILLMRLSAI